MITFRDPRQYIFPLNQIANRDADIVPYSNPQQQLPQYYSRKSHRANRTMQTGSQSTRGTNGNFSQTYRFETATAYAVKTARYPVLYEKLTAPREARKALRDWKRSAIHDGVAIESSSGNQGLIGDGDIEMQPLGSSSNCSVQPEPPSDDSPPMRGDHTGIVQSTPTDGLTGALVHRDSLFHGPQLLPAQYMIFSNPVIEKTKRGSLCKIHCRLQKSYPNFHLEAEYQYVDRREESISDSNRSSSETRLAFVSIRTKEHGWVVALERKGYNEVFIRNTVGADEYERLEEESQDSGLAVKGQSLESSRVKVGRKIALAESARDLGGLSLQVMGFYRLLIAIPSE